MVYFDSNTVSLQDIVFSKRFWLNVSLSQRINITFGPIESVLEYHKTNNMEF